MALYSFEGNAPQIAESAYVYGSTWEYYRLAWENVGRG